MKLEKEEKQQQEKKDVSVAPINISNKFIDFENVVQAPMFRILGRGQERKKNIKLYSSHTTYDLKTKNEIELYWRFDIAEELSIFDFKMYLYLLNKYIQKDLIKYIDLDNKEPDDKLMIDLLAITANTYICKVPLLAIAKDLGYKKPNPEDKKRILDSLIRLQKVFVFFQ